MIPYIILALCPAFLSIFLPVQDKVTAKQKRVYLFCTSLVMLFFLGFRSPYLGSSDTYYYCKTMETATRFSTLNDFFGVRSYEKGFLTFVWLLSRITQIPQALIFVSSAIYVFSISFFLYHNIDNLPLGMTIYIALGIMLFQLQGMRQAIAMSICLIAYELAKRKKLIWFILVVLFAAQFHQTAILFMIVYLLCHLKYSIKTICFMFVGAIAVVAFADWFMKLANAWFDRNYPSVTESGGYIMTLILILILVFTLVFDKKMKTNTLQPGLLYISCVCISCFLLRYFGASIAERISFYFLFADVALVPNTIGQLRNRRVINFAVGLLFIILFIFRLNRSEFLPYEFFWNVTL